MSQERAEELYERALELAPEARAEFLREACGGDTLMEQELASLLQHAAPAESLFAGLERSISAPLGDTRVGPYQLIGVLGAGGMGTVYRAHDPRLDRMVALKFLPPFLWSDSRARNQFLVEARAAAALDHANVCAVHEIGTTTDGRPFIAMACYEGETLRERLDRGALTPHEAADIASQIARGLAAAHARGIIHRDVKPGNVMLCTDGTVRLLDFGLAKMADTSVTGPGTTPGTIAYMSPEQVRGDPLTPQTDLWSLGVVLYEMLTGVRPFRGGNDHLVLQAIQHDQPDPAGNRAILKSPPLARIVEQTLQKTLESRYVSAETLLADLARVSPSGKTGNLGHWFRIHRRSSAAAIAVLGSAALFLAAQAFRSGPASAEVTGASARVRVAVLPFTVRGPGLEIWKEGMVDLLSRGLDGVAGIHTVDSRTLLARWHESVPVMDLADLEQSLAIARQVNANHAILGSAVVAGSRIRLIATIRDAATGMAIGTADVEGPQDSILSLVDRLGMQALEILPVEESQVSGAMDVAKIVTTSPAALKAYLEGEAAYRRSDFPEATRSWRRATRADSQFALAYLGLTDVYGWYVDDPADQFQTYFATLQRTRELAQRLPGRERALLEARWARHTASNASSLAQLALQRYPDAANLWYELGETYFHDARTMAGPAEAVAAFEHAAELQPETAPLRLHLLDLAFRWKADSAVILREVAAYARLAPDEASSTAGRLAFTLRFGDAAARADARDAIDSLDSETALQLFSFMTHPRFAEVRRELIGVITARAGPRTRALVLERVWTLAMIDGRAEEALALLEEPAMPAGARYCTPLYFLDRGLPVPKVLLERRLAAARADSIVRGNPGQLACAAGYAARLKDWSSHRSLLSHARDQSARERAAGDSAGAARWATAMRAGEAYELELRGDKQKALRALESLLDETSGRNLLWRIGQLAFDLGEMDTAERAFRALWNFRDGAPARFQLAQILERTGRPAEAREAYQFVADAWARADAELQPVVAEARQAVIRLSPDNGTMQ